jgi:metal-sulfur cluster biosynthetic enzyme
VPGVSDCELDLVWDPPWDMEMMSETAKLELNF